ncbi:MAG: DUF3857 domain-containing protein [Bacteroidota bacterium]
MIYLKSLLIGAICFMGLTVRAQQPKNVAQRTFKFGKVEPAEFETKVKGTDSAAAAVILFNVGKGEIDLGPKGWEFVFERHFRVKIFSKTALEFGNLELAFFRADDAETYLDKMEGATYNMEGGKMVMTKIGKESKFTDKQDNNFTIKKFALPNVKEGSIIEFKYTVKSDFFGSLMPWHFQNNIPTLYSEYDVRLPPFFKYRVTQNGDIKPAPKKEYIKRNFISFYANIIDATVVRSLYTAENIPALKTESYITSMDDYISKIEFDLNTIDLAGSSFLDNTRSWPKVVTSLEKNPYFGGYVNKRDYIKTLLKQIIKDGVPKDTLPHLIFEYVKNNIKWSEYNSYLTSDPDPKKIFEKKLGNSADINLAMLAMFKEAKLEAWPILISTRSNGKHPGTPSTNKFNNLVIDVKLGERHIFFDATSKNHTADLIAFDDLNHVGFKVDFDKKSGEWVNTEEGRISKRNVSYILTLDKENHLQGKLFLLSTDYNALDRRNQYISANSESEFLKKYKVDKPGLGIKDYKAENMNNPAEPLSESMDIQIDDAIEEGGNLLYFTPLLFDRIKDNPFKLENRQFPVDFGHPREDTYKFIIEVPAEYKLEKLPSDEKISLLDDGASFTFTTKQDGNKFVLTSKVAFNKAVYSPAEYRLLKTLYTKIVSKHAEQIVIKKL